MFLDIQLILRECLVKILLEHFETHGITVFMLAIVLAMFLKTVVGKMNIIVFVIQRVRVATCSQVAFLVIIELLLVRGECPHADVELPPLEQQGFLDILLNDPVRVELAG
jgi:hypothetical protein